jgi:2-keto-4-pentenoate hydratase/2-oxohepta-3-ene-1,7-dioic acid hydratase in catechol pathway
MQQANTKDMIFDIPSLIAYITEGITLEPGDVIVSGTPAGVGNARKPPIYLRDGDVCEIEIEGIGKLCNPVVDEA